MDKVKRLQELYSRLAELGSVDENFNESFAKTNELTSSSSSREAKERRLSELKSKLSEIDNKMTENKKIDNPDLSLKDQALQIERGVFKSYGGAIDLIRKTIPDDAIVNQNLDLLSGGTLTPSQIESLKVDPNQSRNLAGSAQSEAINQLNEIAGKDLYPTTTGGKFREKLGEFGSIPGGTKAVPAIAGVATGLEELGLDEGYADLIAAIGVPNAKAIAKLPGKVLKKLGDYISTIGNKEYRIAGNVEKAAEFLQKKVGDTNIPKVLENIDNYETPFKGNISEGEAAYRPLTADIANDVGLSQYHRAKAENIPEIGRRRQTNAEVLQREIDKLADKNATPQASQEFAASERSAYESALNEKEAFAKHKANEATNEFNQTTKAEEAGKTTREYLVDRVSGIEKEAQMKASPLYESAKLKNLEGEPKGAFEYIKEQMRDNSRASNVHRDMKKSKIAIDNAIVEPSEKGKIIASAKKRYKDDPAMLEIALKEIGDVPHGTYNVGRLDKAKREISRILDSVPYQEKDRRRILTNLLEKLDKDMESIPEIFEARKVYREVMAPANIITENPILGKIIKKEDGYTRPFTVTEAEIPDRVVKASKSIDGAKTLISEAAGSGTKEHKTMINTLKSYINSEILANFVENNGKVNPDKFKIWSKNNPGAFILYPELSTKLKNLKNAQIHVDRVIKQNEELISNFYSESMKKMFGSKFEGVNPDKIAGRILDSADSEAIMQETLELLSKDKTGNASEGLRRGIINHLKSKFKSDNFTFATLNDYLKKNKKALSKAFTPEQISVLENSKDLLKIQAIMERAGKGTNSDSIPKLMENLAEKNGGKASQALFGIKNTSTIGNLIGYVKGLGDIGKLEYVEKALLNPKMAKFLLKKDIKTKKNFFESLNNKEDFGKWLRNSESFMESLKDSSKDIKNNFSITSQSVAKTLTNENSPLR